MANRSHVTLALVGCGDIAGAHWRGIQTHAPRVRVTAVVDVDPARAQAWAGRTGATAFTSLDDALSDGDFDAVDIMTPPHLHEAATLASFVAGKHVLLEKPMATTPEACERIVSAAERAGTVFMIAEQAQYWPRAVKAQQLIQDGAIGEVITARALFSELVPQPQGTLPWRYDAAKTGGGICFDGGLHRIRPLRMWLGEVDEVIATLGHPIAEMEGESQAQALFRFKSGVVASYGAIISYTVDGASEEFTVLGTEGTIVMDHGRQGRCLLYNSDAPQGQSFMPEGRQSGVAYGLELADFAAAVLDGAPLSAGPEDALNELRIVWAMYRSAESGCWEKVDYGG